MDLTLDALEVEDADTIRAMIEHFNFPKSDALTEALEDLERCETAENKIALGKAFIKYCAETPEVNFGAVFGADPADPKDLFNIIDERMVEANEVVQKEDDVE